MSQAAVLSGGHVLDDVVLYRTETGGRLHLPACPHIGGAIREADAAERLGMSVCSWCQAEIDGVGRTYYESLDDAMRAFGCHVGTQPTIRNALRCVTHDQIWLPYSRSYIALGHEGRAVAWVGKTWVMPSLDVFQELPGYRDVSRGGAHSSEHIGELCPTHFLTMSVTGVCESCD